MLSQNGHKTDIQKDNVSKKKEKKRYINPHYIPQENKTFPLSKSPMLTLPLSIWLLSIQNYSRFLSQMTKGKSLRSDHLLITEKASILILIIITEAIIIVIIL